MTSLMSRNTFNLENGDYTKDWRKIPAVQLQIKDDPARGVWVRQLCGVTAVAAAASEWNPPTRQTQLVWRYPAWFSRTYQITDGHKLSAILKASISFCWVLMATLDIRWRKAPQCELAKLLMMQLCLNYPSWSSSDGGKRFWCAMKFEIWKIQAIF